MKTTILESTRARMFGARASRVLAGRNSKVDLDADAPILARGAGARVWDVDANEYLDLSMNDGRAILGRRHPAVDRAIRFQLDDGAVASPRHPLLIELAERLTALFPCAERVRFTRGGEAALALAVRLARESVGREGVLICGDPSDGRRDDRPDNVFAENDPDGLHRLLRRPRIEPAAIVLRPGLNADVEPGFLEVVCEMARRVGARVIFDERCTGLRLGPGGAQTHCGVMPDLAVLGESMANDRPIGAAIGRAESMRAVARDEVDVIDPLDLAAALATLKELSRPGAIDSLVDLSRALRAGARSAIDRLGAADRVELLGSDARWRMRFRAEDDATTARLEARFHLEARRRGLWIDDFVSPSLSHGAEDLTIALEATEEALAEVLRD